MDIKYRDNKEKFINLPILTEKKIIENKQLSEYTRQLMGEQLATKKLIFDFIDQLDYAVHIKN